MGAHQRVNRESLRFQLGNASLELLFRSTELGQLHQPLGAKANHLAQEVGVGALPEQRLKVHRVVGHWWSPSVECCNPTLSEDHRWPPREADRTLQRYGGARVRSASLPASYTITADTTARNLIDYSQRWPWPPLT